MTGYKPGPLISVNTTAQAYRWEFAKFTAKIIKVSPQKTEMKGIEGKKEKVLKKEM